MTPQEYNRLILPISEVQPGDRAVGWDDLEAWAFEPPFTVWKIQPRKWGSWRVIGDTADRHYERTYGEPQAYHGAPEERLTIDRPKRDPSRVRRRLQSWIYWMEWFRADMLERARERLDRGSR